VSFQSVYKAANQLLNENVLLKDDFNYKLNLTWLEELVKFGAQTKQAYKYKEEVKEKFQGLKEQWKK